MAIGILNLFSILLRLCGVPSQPLSLYLVHRYVDHLSLFYSTFLTEFTKFNTEFDAGSHQHPQKLGNLAFLFLV